MSFSLERRQSSGELKNSKAVKERVPSHYENQNLKYQGKLKVKTPAQCSELPCELQQEANGKILVQPKSSGNHQSQYLKVKDTKDDELVKYMSNLPDYLRPLERGKSFQDKVLNVGVLDWARLEKWKYNQKCTQASGSNNLSATGISLSVKTTVKPSTSSSATQGGTYALQSEQHLPLYPSLDWSHKDGLSRSVKQSSQKVLNFQDFKTSPKSNIGGQGKIQWTHVTNNADVFVKGKTKGSDQQITSEKLNFSSNLSNNGVSLSPKEKLSAWDGEVNKRVEKTRESNINRKASLGMGSYPKSRSHGVSLSSQEKISAGNVKTKKRTEKIQESNIDLDHQHLSGKLENIVLLSPRELSQHISPEKSRVQLDENCIKVNRKSLSGSFSLRDVCSTEHRSDIPHSYPLPSKVVSETESNLMALGPINSQNVELSSDASCALHYSNMTKGIHSEGKDTEHNTMKHGKCNAIENLEVLDLEMAEMAGTRSSNPSLNRRFSFSLSRISRSLSWKDSSAVPQSSSSYVSVKSGPVKSEVSCSDDRSRQKTSGHNRARSSPLRRILDTMLRSKGSNPARVAETNVQPLKGSSSKLNFRPNKDSTSVLNENNGASTTQALLQLTTKNGLPLFKFAVDNNSRVLAATMNKLTSGKDDSGQHYTFYSVNEMKRKGGGWISQGSKQKHCGFVYNVVGQMVSSTYFSKLTGQNFKIQYMARESVLFGVELRQADQASPKFMPSKELAAVAVKTLIDAEPRDEDMTPKCFTECVPQGGCSCTLGENDRSSGTTVVLPGGVHGLPKKGAPSPLIKRWKSGGLCDCGGWDVGCKLRVLANHNQSHRIPMTSNAYPNSDRFELFEVGAQQNRPIFRLEPLNREIYSVEFHSSLSLLQALFVCVTVISSQKSSELSDFSGLCEAKVVQKEAVEMNGRKNPTSYVVGKMPAKYAPNPPHSPVGRI